MTSQVRSPSAQPSLALRPSRSHVCELFRQADAAYARKGWSRIGARHRASIYEMHAERSRRPSRNRQGATFREAPLRPVHPIHEEADAFIPRGTLPDTIPSHDLREIRVLAWMCRRRARARVRLFEAAGAFDEGAVRLRGIGAVWPEVPDVLLADLACRTATASSPEQSGTPKPSVRRVPARPTAYAGRTIGEGATSGVSIPRKANRSVGIVTTVRRSQRFVLIDLTRSGRLNCRNVGFR